MTAFSAATTTATTNAPLQSAMSTPGRIAAVNPSAAALRIHDTSSCSGLSRSRSGCHWFRSSAVIASLRVCETQPYSTRIAIGNRRGLRPSRGIGSVAWSLARPKRVELLLPIRTRADRRGGDRVIGAFIAIGSTFLIVFIGIFLGLVFEFPVRFVMRKTNMSRGLAATITVLGTAVGVVVIALLFLVPMVGSVRDFLHELPQTVDQLRTSDELSWLGDTGIGGNAQEGADKVSAVGARRDLGRARDRGRLLRGLPRRLHDPLHLPLLPERRRQPQGRARAACSCRASASAGSPSGSA